MMSDVPNILPDLLPTRWRLAIRSHLDQRSRYWTFDQNRPRKGGKQKSNKDNGNKGKGFSRIISSRKCKLFRPASSRDELIMPSKSHQLKDRLFHCNNRQHAYRTSTSTLHLLQNLSDAEQTNLTNDLSHPRNPARKPNPRPPPRNRLQRKPSSIRSKRPNSIRRSVIERKALL